MRHWIIFILWLLTSTSLGAQDRSNRGTEFWLGYGNNVLFDHEFPVNSQQLQVYLSSEEAATVTVTVNGTGWSQVVNLPANSVDVSVTIPKDGPNDCRILQEGLFNRAIHIESTVPIVVYAHQYATQLSGATMLLPVETYGYSYYSVNFLQPALPGYAGRNWCFVIASEDNTTVAITASDSTEGGILPGQTITVNLNKGELYNIFGLVSNDVSKDLTGTKIASITGADGNCHPIAVFSGCSRFITCLTDGGEVAQQQLFPASAWGTRYLTFHSIISVSNPLTTPQLNFYRVMVMHLGTVVKRNGVVMTGLQQNRFYEFQSNSGDYIEADQPILVCQYTPNSNQCTGTNANPQGDAELYFLPSIEQGIKKARIYNTRNSNISVCYLTIIVPNNGLASLRIDGAAVPASQYRTHPANPDYSIVAKRLLGAAGQHTIVCDSAFSAMLYGSSVYESYGYIAGTLINNLNAIGSLQNVYNSSGNANEYTCPKTPFLLTIQLAYRATSLQWLLSSVPGLSPASDTTITNPIPTDSTILNGRRYYSYVLPTPLTLTDTGTINIPVVYTSPDIDHCSQLERTSIAVVVKSGPVSDFNVAYAGCSTDTAHFTGLPDVNQYPITTYAWAVDNTAADSAIQMARRLGEGSHAVKLTIIANNGCMDDTTRIVNSFPKPLARFGYDRLICAGDRMQFSDSATIAAGNLQSWHWMFGDGADTIVNYSTSVTHAYPVATTYTVALVVQSDKGCFSDTSKLSVLVKERPSATFIINGKPCVDSSFTLTPTVVANGNIIQNIYWDFGDGQQQMVTNTGSVNHSFGQPQSNIPVKLSVSGGIGCASDTTVQIIPTIHAAPLIAFAYTGSSFCPGSSLQFNASGISSGGRWLWDFGSSTATGAVASASFSTTGTFPVTLHGWSADGCGAIPADQNIIIYQPPSIDAGPSLLITSGQSAILQASLPDTGLYQFQWTPADFLSNPSILNPASITPTDMLYTIRATGGPGNCTASDTVSVKVLTVLYIPNAFSPNGNSINERWNIPGINGNPNATVTIYNRYGQIVFASRGYTQPWDGSYKGVPQPSGTYIYQIKPDVKKEKIYTGTVTIVR